MLPMLSLVIAALSLAASIQQGINYSRNIETVQKNVLRTENLKTCRDVIEVFFAFRLKAEEAQAAGPSLAQEVQAASRREMKALVYRFGGLGTFLANFAPEAMRARYAALAWKMNEIADKASGMSAEDFAAKFAIVDADFSTLNEDCAKAAQFVHL
jgi:hypothetical protein